MEKSIIEKLLSEYESFTMSEKKIADYVVANQRACMGIGITELASECAVAVSTVSVFCRKLKLAGFNDFKLELARANSLEEPNEPRERNIELTAGDSTDLVLQKTCMREREVLRCSAKVLDSALVDRAVDLLVNARHVVLLGQGNHTAVAMTAWAQFAMTDPKFQTVQDSHMQTIVLSNLGPEDVVVYFSYSGATLEIMDAVQTIRQVGARLILVTRFQRSPAAEFADVVLISGADERPMQFGSFDALFSQMYVVDVLLSCYCLRCKEQVEHSRDFIGKELTRKQL